MDEHGGVWVGAEVCYVGPEGDGPLQPGVRGTVAETTAGRGMAGLVRGRRPRLRRGEVLVALADGETVAARLEDLEVTTAPHALRPEPDATDARWLLDALRPWTSAERTLPVASFVPDSLPAVVKVLHPWASQEGVRTTWSQVAADLDLRSVQALSDRRSGDRLSDVGGWQPPEQGLMTRGIAEALVEVLSTATATPEDVYVAVWQGFGGFPYERFTGAAVIPTEARGHRLLRGPLEGVLDPVTEPRPALETSGIWWPADRTWVVATEVDFEWTFVAGAEELMAHLAEHPALEVLHTDMDAPANRLDEDRPA